MLKESTFPTPAFFMPSGNLASKPGPAISLARKHPLVYSMPLHSGQPLSTFPTPVEILGHIRDLLKPGGRLFVDTGIGDDWLDRMLPGVCQWYDPPQHLFVFSIAGLRHALEKAGFDLVEVDTCFERNSLRKAARIARGAMVAAGLRAISFVGQVRPQSFEITRYPLGNLMSAVAVEL